MRTLKQINVVHDKNYALFPDGAIQNEIDGTQEGTPVIREVYNDILMNVYSYIRDRGFLPNGQEDSLNNGYQLIEALRRNVNILNDSEKILSLSGSTWNINIDFSLLPDKYFVFARSAEDYLSTATLIKGTGPTNYPFSSASFKTGDELLIILDKGSVRTYNLSSISAVSQNTSFNVFGTPLSYLQNTSKIWYEKDGNLYSDLPENYNLSGTLQSYYGQPVEVRSTCSNNGRIFLLIYLTVTKTTRIVYFNSGNMVDFLELNSSTHPLNGLEGSDYNVLMFMNSDFIYITNDGNNNPADNQIACYKVNIGENDLNYQSTYILHNSFVKTTNCVIDSNSVITFYNNVLRKFPFAGSSPENKDLPNFAGNIFKVNNLIYFTNGINAVKWTI